MAQKRKKQIIAAVTIFSTFFMGLPIQAADCPLPDTNQVTNVKSMAPVMNFLSDKENCNGIISRPEEVSLLQDAGSILIKYSGYKSETDLKGRGEELSKLVESYITKNHLTGDEAKEARAQMLADLFAESTGIAENVANAARAYEVNHPGPIPKAFYEALARMGKVSDPTEYIHETAKPNEPLLHSLAAAGATQNAKGSWDWSKIKLSVSALQDDSVLSTAIGKYFSPLVETRLRDPRRTMIVSDSKVVFLPPNKSGNLKVISVADWESEAKIAQDNIQSAIGVYLSKSQDENTVLHAVQHSAGDRQKELGERQDAADKMTTELMGLQKLGFPVEGIEDLKDKIEKARATGDQLDKQGIAKLQALDHAIKTTAAFALVGGGIAGLAKLSELGDAAAEVAEIAKGGKTAARIEEELASSARGLGDYMKVVRGSASFQKLVKDTAGAMTVKNMFPMAAMPYGFSTLSSVINAAIDVAAGKGYKTAICNMKTDMSEKSAGNLLMSNFAWATPAATLAGSFVRLATASKEAATGTMSLISLGQTAGFTAMQAPGALKGGSECLNQLTGASDSSTDQDATISHGKNVLKQCAAAGTDLAFFGLGLRDLGGHISTASGDLDLARQTAEDRTTRTTNVVAAKDRAKTGMLNESDHIVDGKGVTASVINSGVTNDGKAFVVVRNDITQRVIAIPAEQLKNGKSSMLFGKDDKRFELATAAKSSYEALPPADIKLDTAVAEESKGAPLVAEKPTVGAERELADTASEGNPKDSVGEKIKTDKALASREGIVVKRINKIWDSVTHSDAKLKNEISMKMVVDDLNFDDFEKLEKKLELKPKEIAKVLRDADADCAGREIPVPGARNDSGGWDPEGNFVGILYAQNDASCFEF